MRDSRCLVQALALTRLLRARGHAAHLRIGVQRPATGFHAHAWVELAGRIIDPQASAVTALTRLPLPAAPSRDGHPDGAHRCG